MKKRSSSQKNRKPTVKTSVQRAGWLQPIPRPLGTAPIHDGGRNRDCAVSVEAEW